MANPVAAATAAVKAPIGWAKAKPIVFAAVVVIAIGLGIRFRSQLAKLPLIGFLIGKLGGA